MSETKWSKGPWSVVDRKEYLMSANDPRWSIEQASGQEPFWIALAINRENADILAVAPEMYAQLDRVRSAMVTFGLCGDTVANVEIRNELLAEIVALLAKARGES